MIKALPADAAQKSLADRVYTRSPVGRAQDLDATRCGDTGKGGSERAVVVADQVRWGGALGRGLPQLVGYPFTAVWCDLNGKRVVAVQLGRAFLSLRNALPKCTQCGSDGIRTRGLLRDRQAC